MKKNKPSILTKSVTGLWYLKHQSFVINE